MVSRLRQLAALVLLVMYVIASAAPGAVFCIGAQVCASESTAIHVDCDAAEAEHNHTHGLINPDQHDHGDNTHVHVQFPRDAAVKAVGEHEAQRALLDLALHRALIALSFDAFMTCAAQPVRIESSTRSSDGDNTYTPPRFVVVILRS